MIQTDALVSGKKRTTMLVVLCDVKQIGNIEAMTDMKMEKTCPSEKEKLFKAFTLLYFNTKHPI